MSKNNKPVIAASVTPSLAELQKLTPIQAACNFVEQSTSAIRAFIVAAKLLLVLEPTLKPGQTLGGVVIKLANVGNGLRRRIKSTIDNGRYAMRVWKELVETGHIKEAVFDTFTFGDFVAINRAMSGKSRQVLKPADVALVIESAPDNWHEELDCLFTYGQSLADRVAADAKAKTVASGVPTGGSAETADTTTAQSTDAQGADTGPSPDAPEPAAGKIVPMPKQVQATTEDAFKLIATLEIIVIGLPMDEVAKVAPAIAELHATVQAHLKPAKKTAKRKAARAKKAA